MEVVEVKTTKAEDGTLRQTIVIIGNLNEYHAYCEELLDALIATLYSEGKSAHALAETAKFLTALCSAAD